MYRISALVFAPVLSVFAQAQSPLRIEKTELPSTYKLKWNSVNGRTYFIQQSGNLSSWSYIPEVIPGIGAEDWMGVASIAEKAFFRMISTSIPTVDELTADHDGDGVPSYAELTVTNTDPLKFSTAGNGVSDRNQFPNPPGGIYVDSTNGIQYVIVPNSAGVTGAPKIVATHYFESPDYAVEFKKGSLSLNKHGFLPFGFTDPNTTSVRYLALEKAVSITDWNYNRITAPDWLAGYTADGGNVRKVIGATYADSYEAYDTNPLTGAVVRSGGTLPAYIGSTAIPTTVFDSSYPDYRNRFIYAPNWYYDLPPYNTNPVWGFWDASCRVFYEETFFVENTLQKVGDTAKANRPVYPATWTEGNPWVLWDNWGNQLGLTYSRAKFRIKNKNGVTNGEPAHVAVYFDAENGSAREQVSSVTWNGSGLNSPEYEIDPATLKPGIEGTFHLNVGSMFFELDLAQADGRRAGQTVVIPMLDEEGAGENLGNLSTLQMQSFSAAGAATPLPDIKFPGMDDSWYEGATITLTKTSGSGNIQFKAVSSQTGHQVPVVFGQNLAADFFHSRGSYSSYEWKIEGATPGPITVALTYSKGSTNLVLTRTALVLGQPELLADLDNNGLINGNDSTLQDASFQAGASTETIEAGTEYILANDNFSNGAWDREDTNPARPSSATGDDDAQAISISSGATQGEVWFTHPGIAGLSFYRTKECNLADKLSITDINKFVISSSNPLPATIFARVDGAITFPLPELQIAGELVLNYRNLPTDTPRQLTTLKLILVKEFGAPNFFNAAHDYIMENNTEVFVHDKGFPVNSTNPTARLRISAIREAGTVMYPFEAYQANYDFWLASGSPGGGFDVSATRVAAGLQEVSDLDNSMSLVINGNLCDFSDGTTSVEAAALSAIGMPLMTDKCHGQVKELNASISSASNTHYDPTTNAPGTNMKGHRFAGPDPIPGSSPPLPGGKFLGQYDDNSILFGPGHAPTPIMTNTTVGFSINQTTLGGLATNYGDPAKDMSANQMIGHFRAAGDSRKMIFTASDIISPSGVTGYIGHVYSAAKSSGVADLDGATHAAGSLKPIELLILDGSSSVSLAYKNQSGSLTQSISLSKNVGFPYFINTFLRFKATKPRP